MNECVLSNTNAISPCCTSNRAEISETVGTCAYCFDADATILILCTIDPVNVMHDKMRNGYSRGGWRINPKKGEFSFVVINSQ